MVGRIQHTRVVCETGRIERAQHFADVVVEKSAKSVICCYRLLKLLGVEKLVI